MNRLLLIVPALMVVSSCNQNKEASSAGTASAPAQQATVFLRDGMRFSGTVTSASPTQVTIAGEGANSRTFDMKDVKSIEYGTPVAETLPPAAPPVDAGIRRQSSESSHRSIVTEPAPDRALHRPPVSDRRPVTEPAGERAPQQASRNARSIELPVGTEVAVRTNETIDSQRAADGQSFSADVSKDILDASGAVVIPRGSNADVVIKSSSRGGRVSGASDLLLDLHSITIGGRQYAIETADIERSGKDGLGTNKRTAEYVGGGALVGSIIGAIAGHGKGAAIGAASGAAAGAATQVITRGKSIRVPAETILTFRLDQPLRIFPVQR